MMRASRLKIIAGVLLVFLLGAGIGSLGTFLYVRQKVREFVAEGPPPKRLERLMRHLLQDLGLSAEQRKAVEDIAKDMQVRMAELRTEYRPQVREIVESHLDKIEAILTPEQRSEMAEIRQRIEERWRRHGPPHRGGKSFREERTVRFLARRLDLTPEQAEAVEPVIHDFQEERRRLTDEMPPDDPRLPESYRKLRLETLDRLRGILDSRQMAELREMIDRRQSWFGNGHHHDGGR